MLDEALAFADQQIELMAEDLDYDDDQEMAEAVLVAAIQYREWVQSLIIARDNEDMA